MKLEILLSLTKEGMGEYNGQRIEMIWLEEKEKRKQCEKVK